jgi:hypothetical protein
MEKEPTPEQNNGINIIYNMRVCTGNGGATRFVLFLAR